MIGIFAVTEKDMTTTLTTPYAPPVGAALRAMSRQSGLRQRSLRRCRMGRATELVFVLATGAALTLAMGGQAVAQARGTTVTYTADSDINRSGVPLTLIVPNAGDTFTQSGRVTAQVGRPGESAIIKRGAGTLILTSPDNALATFDQLEIREGAIVWNSNTTNSFPIAVNSGAGLALTV